MCSSDLNAGDELTITIVATGFDENKQVYTKKQKDDDEPQVRTFGFKPRAEEVKELDTEDEVLESFEKDELPEVDNDDSKVTPVLPVDDIPEEKPTGDSLWDVPAFLRRGKKD